MQYIFFFNEIVYLWVMNEQKIRKQAQQLINKKLFSVDKMAKKLGFSKPTLMKLRTLSPDVSMDRVFETIEKLKK